MMIISFFFGTHHLSRHCLPILPGKLDAMMDHFLGPNSLTSALTFASSSGVHGPLIKFGFNTFCHLWRHCTSVRSGKLSLIFFQFLASCSLTRLRNNLSSSCVHLAFWDRLRFLFFFLERKDEEVEKERKEENRWKQRKRHKLVLVKWKLQSVFLQF